MGYYRDFLVGKVKISSRTDFKYAMLRSQFAGIIMVVAIFYISLDSYNRVFTFIPYYAFVCAGAIISFLLNRQRKYTAATLIQLTLINVFIFFFADAEHPYGGVYFYFMACSIIGLILFSYYNRILSIVFAIIPIVLGIIAFSTDFDFVPEPSYEPHMVRINFISNLTIGILAPAFVVYFLITRNREAEQNLMRISSSLKKSEERFLMALHGTKAGIYEWRLAENSIYVSSDWKQLLGYENHELNNLNQEDFTPLVYPEDRERTLQLVTDHILLQKPYQNEFRLLTKNGVYKWFQDSGTFKPDETGSGLVLIGTLMDIDKRKKAEEELAFKNSQLAKTNEELDRFVYSASHDMRAPLSSLLGLIHLSEKTDKPEEVGLFLMMMKERIKTMEGFIKEVTDYSRNTRLELTPTPVFLASLVKDVVQILGYTVVNHKVRIDIKIDRSLELSTDPNRLKVVINNLVSNAYKYHRFDQSDPFIEISAIKKNNCVLITIKDNGIGIAPEHHARIFEMFYRASESSDGSGLGLYIVKETLDKLQGSISMQSVPDKGSEFTITLPLSL